MYNNHKMYILYTILSCQFGLYLTDTNRCYCRTSPETGFVYSYSNEESAYGDCFHSDQIGNEESDWRTPLVQCDCSMYPCTERRGIPSTKLSKSWSWRMLLQRKQRFIVDTSWGAWSRWSDCTASCGSGVVYRGRSCRQGTTCTGLYADVRPCRAVIDCPALDHWRAWMPWTSCSMTSSLGVKERIRQCDLDDQSCNGPYRQTTTCCRSQCPGPGVWTSWEEWTSCSSTCGNNAHTSRNRVCIPSRDSGPLPPLCLGEDYQVKQCNYVTCTVTQSIPLWEVWSTWSECTCSHCPCSGQRFRMRKCSVEHACGGAGVQGDSCVKPCPTTHTLSVEGGWSAWHGWSSCTGSCQASVQYRVRTCTHPQPSSAGKTCSGNFRESRSCQDPSCPVDGQWGAWNGWTYCSSSCGPGSKQRSRSCNNPRPRNGGKYCTPSLAYTKQVQCNEKACPVPKWSEWSPWDPCSQPCGPGMQSRWRSCDQGNGSCVGVPTEQRICTGFVCPVDGIWSQWQAWTSCSLTCNNGTKTRTRTCSNPAPTNGGAMCVGADTDVVVCNVGPCPVDGQWSPWLPWSRCTVTCGLGARTRNRACVNPVPQHGGQYCAGNDTQRGACSEAECGTASPIDGHWSDWLPWSRCTVTCGEGTQTRNRACVNPLPQHNGRYCTGNDTQIVKCLFAQCS